MSSAQRLKLLHIGPTWLGYFLSCACFVKNTKYFSIIFLTTTWTFFFKLSFLLATFAPIRKWGGHWSHVYRIEIKGVVISHILTEISESNKITHSILWIKGFHLEKVIHSPQLKHKDVYETSYRLHTTQHTSHKTKLNVNPVWVILAINLVSVVLFINLWVWKATIGFSLC